jgi:poly(3-hydroxybutyrate) depolymerase
MNQPLLPSFGLAMLLGLAAAGCARAPGEALPKLDIDPQRVAVAGLSSGAYMATQAHLAWSDRLAGAAMLAGGPYGCAQATLERALGPCMKAQPEAPDVPALAALVHERAADGRIAPLANLQGDRVLVLHGRLDATVAPAVGRATHALYSALMTDAGEGLRLDAEGDYAHVLPVAASGGDCAVSESPYLGACGIDAAGEVFGHIFGEPLRPVAEKAANEPRAFDQDALRPEGQDAYLAATGYLYVPPTCREGARCGLLVAFHGCEQNAEKVGEAFVREAGFNRWADAFDVAVLYPQTRASYVPLNPRACWDWWGYSGSDYDTRSGVQQRWLRKAMEALGAG